MDFIHDSLWSGRRYRALAVIDHWSRESLASEIDVSLTGDRVIEATQPMAQSIWRKDVRDILHDWRRSVRLDLCDPITGLRKSDHALTQFVIPGYGA